MKKTVLIVGLLLMLSLSLTGCGSNEEILQRLDALESQVALINEAMGETSGGAEITAESTAEPSPTAKPSPTPEPKTVLSYETLTDILGKANVMDGLDDTFLYGGLWISTEEFFIYLTYDCTLTDDVISVIDQDLKASYDGAGFSGAEESFVGDGDLISFSEDEGETLSIGFELSSIETVIQGVSAG